MPTEVSRPKQRVFALAAVALAIAVVAAGLVDRHLHAEQLDQRAAAQAVPTVAVGVPVPTAGGALELPARIEAWSRAPIYARVSGYLKQWNVDIGAPVKAGQVLGVIETPDLDQQLLQAKAELATARSNAALATTTSQRWQALLATDSVSKQEADEKAGDLSAKQSAVNALQANVDRVQSLQRYTSLVAPFDGVVTARNTDVGALIGVGGTPGSELFVVSDIRRLRVYVNVPQRQVAQVRQGALAEITVPERPGRTYAAKVQSLSQSISMASGAMLVQLAVDNTAGELLPGGFASVRFDAKADAAGLSVPPGALIFGKQGVRVATVDSTDRVRLKQVTIARDLGASVELAGGLGKDDRVIQNPPDGVSEGDRVRVALADNTKKAAP
ncbi:efflux RND transporter periplasmic adaptor subunit [Aquabacterium soli]|uniref:Efflux RND transporter periplasmic adaptor subunit n=1 Tax=Aquabacterium soli TaxID=2493092 RepID=A0A426VGI4_9BURK|nr:efflux RND transporter periplasmic adaptor subunit [Aquabacterium soli]RRS05830.1 efflux RND transporter periplasmic adaptor subunit [Aquabacterium soli]